MDRKEIEKKLSSLDTDRGIVKRELRRWQDELDRLDVEYEVYYDQTS